jgi:TRAP-type C4-dicarboxylate transport system permease large subunit
MPDGASGPRGNSAGHGYTGDVWRAWNSHVETIYKVALVIMFLVVIFNLGQALYFMMTEKDESKRTVWALTRRISFSLLLIAMVIVGIRMGWIHPHGVGQ